MVNFSWIWIFLKTHKKVGTYNLTRYFLKRVKMLYLANFESKNEEKFVKFLHMIYEFECSKIDYLGK